MNKLSIFLSILLCVFSFQNVRAQDASQPDDLEKLRKKVEEQERQVREMRELIEKQSAIVQAQQKQIDELLRRSEQSASKTNPAPAEAKVVPPTQAAEVKPTPKPPEKQANNVEAGFGKIRFTGLIQGWYQAGNGINNSLRFRRAQLRFTGQLLPKVRWTVMIDPSRALSVNTTTTTIGGIPVITSISPNQASRIFQEAVISLSYIKDVNIDIGQFKIPLSQEGLQSSSALDTVERALFLTDRIRGGGLGDVRDFGVQFSGPLGKDFNYQIGVFNGVGETQNALDSNQGKALVGRFVVRPPFVKGLQLGISGAWSNFERLSNTRRDRLGGEFLYANKKVRIKTEVMGAADGDFRRLGFYSHVGYRITPKLEAIFRVDGFDPDRRRETNALNVFELDYVTGFNYNFSQNNFKFQLNYVRKTFNNGILPSRNLFLANIQTAW